TDTGVIVEGLPRLTFPVVDDVVGAVGIPLVADGDLASVCRDEPQVDVGAERAARPAARPTPGRPSRRHRIADGTAVVRWRVRIAAIDLGFTAVGHHPEARRGFAVEGQVRVGLAFE